MRMLELFSGTEVMSDTFRRAGHDAVSVEVDERFDPTLRANILNIDWNQFADDYGRFDVMWASPPCRYGDPCHVAAPRGSGLGLKAVPRGKERSRLPQQLCDEVLRMCEEVIQ